MHIVKNNKQNSSALMWRQPLRPASTAPRGNRSGKRNQLTAYARSNRSAWLPACVRWWCSADRRYAHACRAASLTCHCVPICMADIPGLPDSGARVLPDRNVGRIFTPSYTEVVRRYTCAYALPRLRNEFPRPKSIRRPPVSASAVCGVKVTDDMHGPSRNPPSRVA